jgi:alkyl sulfatase BDS1-like metallo-beta-lactamase superfamily hydrolase
MATAALPVLLAAGAAPENLAAAGVRIEGDTSALTRLLDTLDAPDRGFAIVTS